MVQFPWLSIPRFAQPGQPHAFANRHTQLAQLYRQIAHAGNAVRNGAQNIAHRCVVTGYVGVGKSALILQALYMLRGEHRDAPGQRLHPQVLLPEPLDIQRWLILHVSGKRVADMDALADSLRGQIAEASRDATASSAARDPYAGLFESIREQAELQMSRLPAPQLPIFHRLLGREKKLFHEVRTALTRLGQEIEDSRAFAGGTRVDQAKRSEQSDREEDAHIKLATEAAAAGGTAQSFSGKLSAQADASGTRKHTSSRSRFTELERRTRVSSEALVEALNRFFSATRRVGLPTILVLDDFDEVASSIGPSHQDRSRILSSVLGTLAQLTPTVLILGLRKEYILDDVHRQYEMLHVPALSRASLRDTIAAWAEVHEPVLVAEQIDALHARVDRFIHRFDTDAPCVMPFPFLQFVAWMANNVSDANTSEELLLRGYLRDNYSPETGPILNRLAGCMPEEDIERCVQASPLDAAVYSLSARETQVLMRDGLFRHAMAGDPDDQQIFIDPLCAYLRALRT
jgi:hypothetical protein